MRMTGPEQGGPEAWINTLHAEGRGQMLSTGIRRLNLLTLPESLALFAEIVHAGGVELGLQVSAVPEIVQLRSTLHHLPSVLKLWLTHAVHREALHTSLTSSNAGTVCWQI